MIRINKLKPRTKYRCSYDTREIYIGDTYIGDVIVFSKWVQGNYVKYYDILLPGTFVGVVVANKSLAKTIKQIIKD